MGRWGIFIVVFAMARIAYADPTPQQYWATTNVSFQAFNTYLTSSNCYSKPRRFLGCIDALNVLLRNSTANPRRSILPIGAPLQPGTRVISTIEGVQIVENPKPTLGDSNKAQILAARKYSRAVDQLWFRSRPGRIETLVAEFSRNIKTDYQPVVAGLALNAYFANAVDPHSYITPKQRTLDRKENKASYIGIAASFAGHAKGAVVQKVVARGPAALGGLRSADIITSVNGIEMAGLGVDGVNQAIIGPVGETLIIGVERAGKNLKLKVVRKKIVIPNVELSVIPLRRGSTSTINYIKIRNFVATNTCEALGEALRTPASGVIIDLRDNGGGHVDIVACLLGYFVPGRNLVFSAINPYTGVQNFSVFTRPMNLRDNRKLVVLTNQNSASASEIFAGTIQDYLRGYVVGTRSYGKGSVQSLVDPSVKHGTEMDRYPFTGVLKGETTSRYHLASGRSPQGIGIAPDFEAYWTPNPTEIERMSFREDETYRFPLPPGNKIRQPLNPKLRLVRDCVTTSGIAKQAFEVERDYQLQVARDVLACALSK